MENHPVKSGITSIDEQATATIRLLKCRLCSSVCDKGILVFSDEGKKMCLQGYIKKYLYITITMDDKLTKLICTTCCKTIENFHHFATMVAQSQCKLLKQAGHIGLFMDYNQTSINTSKGLLHAYLIKEPLINDHDYAQTKKQKTTKTKRASPRKRKSRAKVKSKNPNGMPSQNEIKTINVNDNAQTDSKVNNPLEENHTSDSNTHETLEVVLDPLIFLENSSCSCKEESIDVDCINKDDSKNEKQCNVCDFSFSSTLETNDILQNKQFTFLYHDYYDRILQENYINNNNGDECFEEAMVSEKEDENKNHGEKCPICGKLGFSKDNLKMHLRIHRPKGKHECDICKRIFKSINSLTQHKLSHNRVQFQCNVCHRVYPTKSTLKAHSITHSDLRPHKCQLCDKSFKRNQDLKFHMNQHTGARPYKCIYCPKAFASSGNCFSHRKRMHPDEVERDRNYAAKILR